MASDIKHTLSQALDDTVAALQSFSEEQMNMTPFEGSWTAAQVGRHIYKSLDGADKLLSAPGEPAGRQADERVEEFKTLFGNMEIKMQSPDFIIPEDKHYDKEELINSLRSVKQAILGAFENNLETVPALPEGHPLIGSTKLELVHFMAYHTQRHNRQIENIRSFVV